MSTNFCLEYTRRKPHFWTATRPISLITNYVISRSFYRILNTPDGFIGSHVESLSFPYSSYAVWA
jgi:hypothetical protein